MQPLLEGEDGSIKTNSMSKIHIFTKAGNKKHASAHRDEQIAGDNRAIDIIITKLKILSTS